MEPRPDPARRELLRSGALLGGACLASALNAQASPGDSRARVKPKPVEASDYIYSTCLQCNTGCEIKVRIQDGMAVKIDGSPYGPRTMDPHIAWTTPVTQVARLNGIICPKGQSGIQTTYDPYRVVKVLKRAGRRGEGKWTTIAFDQAVKEIVEGGALFPQDGGAGVTGLRDLYALRDPKVHASMAADVTNIQDKKMTVAEFKDKYKDYLDTLIDPDHPDFGPKNNQFVFNWGRLKAGRSEFFLRFLKDSFGSTNGHGHTTVCQGSIYFSGKSMSDQPSGGKWTGGAKAYWMADTSNAEFIIYWGANVMEGNYGPPLKVPKITRGLASRKLKVAVIDPRYSKIASKAWKWLPIKPGEDAAFALGMIRWIIDSERYDKRYLANCNKAAATADGEPTWSNGAWLVKTRPDGSGSAFLRASEIGLGGDADTFVCMKDGTPVAFKSDDATNAVEGDLFVDETINGIPVKSGLTLLRDEASKKSVDGWAATAGLGVGDLAALAAEFTSYGKRAVVEIHRGVSQHTNGFYNVLATMGALNTLIGNLDWKGGLVYGGGAYGETGGTGRPFQLADHPAKITPFGIDIIRGGASYEKSTIFSGYPAKRPWYPLASDVYQEVIPSAGDAYPYPIKALFLYMGSPVYALPAGHSLIPTLMDTAKIPLFVCSDITIGETSQYADYIFPDLTYLERWEFHRTHPSIVHRVSPVRQPVVASPNENVRVYGQEMPVSMESLFLAIAERLQLPGFGPGGFGSTGDLNRPEDYYLRMVANIAYGDSSADVCPDASDEEMSVFQNARKHLPKSMFDAEAWARAAGANWWKKVVYVLNRGGRWWSYNEAWSGEQVKAKYGKLVNLYHEKPATTRNSLTGAYLSGLPTYLPVVDSLGRPLDHRGAPLTLITNRSMLACKSRTISNYWLTDIMPENFIEISTVDAASLGLKDKDEVWVLSAANPEGSWDLGSGKSKPLTGRLQVTSRIRPGVVSFSLGYGHWAYGSSDQVIDGAVIPGDSRRATGIHANSAMVVDPHLRSPLSDVVGGSAVFYDSKVFLVKA
ncbi:MAG: molybdopterin-dependent oxidoreductase [Candidatus Solibacter usitatus]|nr:molybdopterin-dependent oxidoreductase [Candidatus Solibacter usitatus]